MTLADHLPDTDPAVVEMMVAAWRTESTADRCRRISGLAEAGAAATEAGVRRRYPGASDDEVRLRVLSFRIPRHLMIAAYRWDPEVEGR